MSIKTILLPLTLTLTTNPEKPFPILSEGDSIDFSSHIMCKLHLLPNDSMEKTINAKLTSSLRPIPHVWPNAQVDYFVKIPPQGITLQATQISLNFPPEEFHFCFTAK